MSRSTVRGRRAALGLALVAVLGIAAVKLVRPVTVTVGFLQDAALAERPDGPWPEVSERDVVDAELGRARLFRPVDREPSVGLVLAHGAAVSGHDDPRLVRLARALARAGFVVLTPDLVDLRSLRITPRSVDRIAAARRWLARDGDGRPVGLMGISVAGSYCLIDAAQAGAEVPFVVSFGGYYDLEALVRAWFEAEPPEPEPGYYPIATYGKWIFMANHLEAWLPAGEVAILRPLLERWVRSGDASERSSSPPAGLGESGRRLYRAAVTPGAMDPELLDRLLEPLTERLRELQPRGRLVDLHSRVYLAHGLHDPLVPPEHTLWMAEELAADRRVGPLISSLFSHADPRDGSAGSIGWREAVTTVGFVHRWLSEAGPPLKPRRPLSER